MALVKYLRAVRPEWLMCCAGMLGVAYCLTMGLQMIEARRIANSILPVYAKATAEASSEGQPPANFVSFSSPPGTSGRPEIVGRVEIPAVGLVTPLLAGDDSMSLDEGAGHIPGTALPGGLGTVGIAGHRDTHFRLLSKVTPGMEVRLVSASGVYHYRITSSEIVFPEQVSVLATGQVPGLALVTCYPFRFIGHAPKRFIVHAELISAAADDATSVPKR